VAIDMALQELQAQVSLLERVVLMFANSLLEPSLCYFNGDRGFRYEAPDVRHFCLLKAVRVVSALNASIELARGGYTQEIGTLMRTVAEFTTHIEFVLDPSDSEKHRCEVENYVQAFFADSRRDPAARIKRAQVRQGLVHESLGRSLDGIAERERDSEGRIPAEMLYADVYRTYSNYVHGKYPEIMDLYGGRPGRFHLRGMGGTPKDGENFGTLETFIVTASNTFVIMIQRLNLRALIKADPTLDRWYLERVEK
jgi:hypothetical protein